MAENRKVQLEVGVEADTSGLDQIAEAAQGMAEAVQEAGQQAAQGLNAVSQAAAPAADGLDAAQRRMQASIQRTVATMKAGQAGTADYFQALAQARNVDTAPFDAYIAELRRVEAAQKAAKQATADAAKADAFIASLKAQADAAGKTRAQLLELQAAQLGLGGQAAPYIKSLKDAEAAAVGAGHATEEFGFKTAAAKRELLVLAHELSQGNIKNFGSSMLVLGERTGAASLLFSGAALTAGVLAGAVIALGVAVVKGAGELKAFQEATTITGNAVGLSASGFTQMRDALAGIAGSKGKAAEVITEIASSGKIASTSVQGIAEAAILMERATGQAVSKTVAQFAELAHSPAEAAAKLNEQYHFLTAAVFAQIKALEDQGRAVDAARLAEDTYAAALKDRAQAVIGNAGLIERAWHGVTDGAKKAWDAMLGIGRDLSIGDQVAAAAAKVAQLQAQAAAGPGPDRGASLGMSVPGLGAAAAGGGQQAINQRLAAARQELADAQKRLEIENRNTAAKAEQNRLEQLGITFHQDDDKFLTKKQKEQKELTKAETEGQELVNAGIITEEQLRTRLNGIRQKYVETTGQSEVANAQARTEALRQYNEELRKQIASGVFDESAKPTPAQQHALQLEKELAGSVMGTARAMKEKELAAVRLEAVEEKENATLLRQKKAVEDAQSVITKQAEATTQQADAIRQQALGQEAANLTFGKSKTAIEQMVLAQLKLQAAEADASDTFDPRYVAGLKDKVNWQERWVAALQKSEAQRIAQQLGEGTRTSKEEADTLQLELSLVGQTQEVRTRILAQRRAELDLAKELAKIDQSGATDVEKEDLRAKARTKALIDSNNAATKAAVDEWQRSADNINQSLTDALLRGFESGEGFAANLRDTVKKMFSQMVLRPIIQGVLSPVSGSLASVGQSIVGGGGSALGGLGGIGNLASLGSSVLGGMSLGNAGATLAANAAGTGIDGLMAATGAFGTAAGGAAAAGAGTGLLGAASAGLAAIGPVGWAALAAIAAYSIFGGKGGGAKTSSGAGIGVQTTGDVAGVANTIKQIQAQYGGIVSGLGGTPGQLDLGIFSAQDPKGTALTQLQVNAALNGQTVYSRDARLGHGNIENVGRSDAELQAAMTEETQRVILSALQASNLTGAVGNYLKQLGDINALSGGAVEASLNRAQTIATQQAQLQSQIFDLTHTDLEKLTATRAKERAAIDETNRALYEQVAQLTDLTTAAQAAQAAVDTSRTSLTDAYQRESEALKAVVTQHTNYAAELRQVRDSLATASGSGLTRAQITARAGRTFQSTLTSALGGDDASLQALGGASTSLVDALRNSAHTPQELAAGIARVQASLTIAAAAEDSRASVAQQQLNAETLQLTQLGVINTSVLSVADAITAYMATVNQYLSAQGQLDAAKAAALAGTTLDPAALLAAIPGHATGGLASGVAQVGERGREVVDFQTPGRVYTSEQTQGMFASNAALEPLLQQVVQLLQTARAEERSEALAMIAPLAKLDSRLKKFDTVGMPPVREGVTP